jgi:predicted HTH transcriptional regulator
MTKENKPGPAENRMCPYFSKKATWSVPCLTVDCMAWDGKQNKCRIIEQSGIEDTMWGCFHMLMETIRNLR